MSRMKKISGAVLVGMVLLLAGCGGDDSGAPVTQGTPLDTGTTPISDGGAITGVPSLSIALTDGAAQTVTTISSGSPATVTATVKNAAGAAVANAVVVFTVDANGLAVLSPSSGTALTNSSGIATVTLAAASLSAAGAATITATSQLGAEAVSGSIGFAVGAASVIMSNPSFGVGTSALSAYGTTSVSVSVYSNGVLVTTPQAVSFTSACSVNGKADLTASVSTINGVATASYRDKGCAGNDTVTASVSGIATASAILRVTPPAAGSIQFDSVTPSSGLINLKGMGGQESALVTFKVVDSSGNPIGGKNVAFSLNTSVGGITLTPTTATSDPVTGNVVVSVQSGTISTPVRVSATTVEGSSTLISQSSKLVISTGIPDQQNFSLSATEFNIEGWDYDGVTTTLTARLADHFNNPVIDDTAVYFTAEGGSVGASCTTVAGACSVTLTSQNLRPNDGRVTVLAYAIGEEGFTDFNVNGLADGAAEMLDANGDTTDMPEAFFDRDEDGVRDLNEEYLDFNGNGAYDSANGEYNGVLCDPSAVPVNPQTACNAQKSIHVRGSMPIVFSTSFANIQIEDGVGNPLDPELVSLALNRCVAGVDGHVGDPVSFVVRVLDQHGNAMPVGTTIALSADNGKILSDKTYIIENTTGCYTGGGCSSPSNSFGGIGVTMQSDATFNASSFTCANTSASGTFTVKVTTPKKNVTSLSIGVTD